MANRAPRDESDDGGGPIFVKNGLPVKFFFHRSVTQGRNRITRDVEKHGGMVVPSERNANVLLVDEQENIELLRRQYYSSTELYRLSLYVEPRGFVQNCIRAGTYHHVRPTLQGMPGRPPGAPRARIAFTEDDRDHLAYYLATRFPTRDGRMGNNAYKDLVKLGETNDRSWEWARRHTFHSWREHYRNNRVLMDARIDFYQQRLEDVGHHFGQDPRRHDFRHLRREEEEDEDEDEEVEEWRGMERRERGRGVRPAVANGRRDQVARNSPAHHEDGIVNTDEENEEIDGAQEEEEADVRMQGPERQRVPLDVNRQREAQAERARGSNTSNDERESDVEVNADQGTPKALEDDGTESQDFEGSDLFGDSSFEKERFDYDDDGSQDMRSFSPRTSPIPDQGPPVSTQATLIASPRPVEKEDTPPPSQTPTDSEAPEEDTAAVELAVPPSSQATMVVARERVVRRVHVRDPSPQPGPSGQQTRDVAADAPFRSTRSRSVQPQSKPQSQPPELATREEVGEDRRNELPLIEEDVRDEEDTQPRSVMRETMEDEMAVEGLLDAPVVGDDEDSDVDMQELARLPGYQDIDMDEPLDSDDAETHESLVRAGEGGGEAADGEYESESNDREEGADGDADDADVSSEPAPVRPEPRVTRSMAAAVQPQMQTRRTRAQSQSQTQAQSQTKTKVQAQTSPRRTRSRAPSALPSPGTGARGVVNPPQGTRGTTLRARGKAR